MSFQDFLIEGNSSSSEFENEFTVEGLSSSSSLSSNSNPIISHNNEKNDKNKGQNEKIKSKEEENSENSENGEKSKEGKRKRHTQNEIENQEKLKRKIKKTRAKKRTNKNSFKFPIKDTILVLRIENVNGEGRSNKKFYTVNIIGIVQEVHVVQPDFVRLTGKYYYPRHDKVCLRTDNLYFEDYGQYKRWYVRNEPIFELGLNFEIKTSQINVKNDESKKMMDAFRTFGENVQCIDVNKEPLAFWKKNEANPIPINLCCEVCNTSTDEDFILICDNCSRGYHIYCLEESLDIHSLPHTWFCPRCLCNL